MTSSSYNCLAFPLQNHQAECYAPRKATEAWRQRRLKTKRRVPVVALSIILFCTAIHSFEPNDEHAGWTKRPLQISIWPARHSNGTDDLLNYSCRRHRTGFIKSGEAHSLMKIFGFDC